MSPQKILLETIILVYYLPIISCRNENSVITDKMSFNVNTNVLQPFMQLVAGDQAVFHEQYSKTASQPFRRASAVNLLHLSSTSRFA